MIYSIYVYNKEIGFYDEYLVRAQTKEEAIIEARRRLDNETDEGAAAYKIIEVEKYHD